MPLPSGPEKLSSTMLSCDRCVYMYIYIYIYQVLGSCLISVFLDLFKVFDSYLRVLDLYFGVLPYILGFCITFYFLDLYLGS